ncbi:MAG: CBS domain-containing protein, partial [Giesbergeria sp.]
MPSPDHLATLLAEHRVWGMLDPSAQSLLAAQWEQHTTTEGAMLLPQGRLHTRLGMVLAGAVDLHDPDLDHAVRVGRGEMFGFGATPARHLTTWQATAATDGAVAWLAPHALLRLCQAHDALEYHFPSLPAAVDIAEQQNGAPGEDGARLNRLAMPVSALLHRAPVCLSMDTPIRTVAEHMREQRVSSVLLVEGGDGGRTALVGLVTDRDLRNRVLAVGMDTGRPVRDIATLAPHTLQSQSPAFDALLVMARANIHHLPVVEGTRIVGMVTATDLAEQQSTSAVVLAGEIYKQTSVAGLAKAATRLKALQRHLAEADASAYSTGHIVTAITDAITVRLIQLAKERMGPAPVEYVWVAAGSQARSEQ